MNRQRLRQIVEGNDTRAGKAFDLTIQALILIPLISFSIETLPHLSSPARTLLRWIEVITVLLFTAEYLLRVYVAERPVAYITSFFGVIDFLAIMPFYVFGAAHLRSLRAFRLMRLFRILKLARYSAAVRRFHRALIIAREELILFLTLTGIVLYVAAAGIYYFERDAQPEQFASIFHSLWWAIVTLTTVGYGDVYPITTGGRLFTFFVLVAGLGVVAVPAGIVASALQQAREMEE